VGRVGKAVDPGHKRVIPDGTEGDEGSALLGDLVSDSTVPFAAKDAAGNRFIFVLIPIVFAVLLVMRWRGYIAVEPLWVYGIIFGIAGILYAIIELHAVEDPSPFRLNCQIAVAAATTTAIMYVTGWGPAMIAGYATAAVLTIFRNGSRTWRLCVFWNLLGIVIGQVAIGVHWAPSKLPIGDSDAIAILAGIGFVAMMRLAATEAQQKERAESLVRINEERFRSLVAHSSDMMLLLDATGSEIRYASPATATLLKCDPETLVGNNPISIVHPDDLERVKDGLAEALNSCDLVRTEFRIVDKENEERDVDAVITDLRTNPAVSGFVVNLHDITERQQLQNNLLYRVQHDILTGLPNRQFMIDRLQESLGRCRRNDETAPTLMFLDLDRFKDVNDQFGHAAGDALLIQFGERLRSIIRESDLLARFGGDEFVILCEGMKGTDAVTQFARRALQIVEEPFLIGDRLCSVGLSVGIASIEQNSTSSEALSHADLAMYEAKRRGDAPHIHFLDFQSNQAVVAGD
jgi:diguanylate cyclase (GGDEF)-like protein/PAS domain S-box-containing protein